jgi:carboxypeptidase C (cathepsin A)
MNLNGLILVSPYFGQVTGNDGMGIDLPHVLYLSTLAATAWYYDAIPNKPASVGDYALEVERFAIDEYAPALLKGYAISPEEKQAMAEKLGRYTGTSAQYWLRADLRVSHQQFLQELLRDRGLIAGRIDARFSGPSLNPLSDSMDYDPFFPAVGPAYTAAFREYLHSELKFDVPDNYVISGGLYNNWDWRHAQPGADGDENGQVPVTNLVPALANAMTMNPGLHLLIDQGFYDLATPTHARIRVNMYDAGHMMYLHEPSGRKFREPDRL